MDKTVRILYADDEQDIRDIVEWALEEEEWMELSICESGRAAVAEARTLRPDLILLDFMMPDLDGPATLLELRALPGLAHTPVVFMTAKAQPDEVERLKGLGAADVIPKPFDPMKLPETIRQILEGTLGD